ncbi:MAG: hypothetical protein ACK5NK_08735, partial [Niabella sp.]
YKISGTVNVDDWGYFASICNLRLMVVNNENTYTTANSVNTGRQQFRYIVIPGGTSAVSSLGLQKLSSMPYEEVIKQLKIPATGSRIY